MANYTFRCQECGEFTEWHRNSKGNKQKSACPTCHAEAVRVFMPPITFRMDSRLKDTISSGMEPKLMKKEELSKTPIKHALRGKPRNMRPWQAGSLR